MGRVDVGYGQACAIIITVTVTISITMSITTTARYCSVACATAHYKAGHKEACTKAK